MSEQILHPRVIFVQPPCPYPTRTPTPIKLSFHSLFRVILLGLLADSRSLAAKNGGSSLHGRALLRLIEGGDAVGDRLENGTTTFFERHRSRAVAGFVRNLGFLSDDDDAFVVFGGGDADCFGADDSAAGQAVESR